VCTDTRSRRAVLRRVGTAAGRSLSASFQLLISCGGVCGYLPSRLAGDLLLKLTCVPLLSFHRRHFFYAYGRENDEAYGVRPVAADGNAPVRAAIDYWYGTAGIALRRDACHRRVPAACLRLTTAKLRRLVGLIWRITSRVPSPRACVKYRMLSCAVPFVIACCNQSSTAVVTRNIIILVNAWYSVPRNISSTMANPCALPWYA